MNYLVNEKEIVVEVVHNKTSKRVEVRFRPTQARMTHTYVIVEAMIVTNETRLKEIAEDVKQQITNKHGKYYDTLQAIAR